MELSKKQLNDISALVKKYLERKAKMEAAEEAYKEAKAAFNTVEMTELPMAMDAAGVDSIKTVDGIKVAIKDDITMSIPKKHKEEANDWLRKNQLGELIKNSFLITLPKGTDKKADALEKQIKEFGFTPERGESVNTTSVKAALKKRIAAGDDVPAEIFGIHNVKKAIVSL